MLQVSELFIYPIKSLGGIALSSVALTERGFEYDRRWMLVDTNNVFLTQRQFPQMALLQVQLGENGLVVNHKYQQSSFLIPFYPLRTSVTEVRIWRDLCEAVFVNSTADKWFSDMLSVHCRLVYMPEHSERFVDAGYARNNEITSFTDGYPIMMIGQASLDDLNSRLPEPLPINRFRPNLVFTGGIPFEEDGMEHFSINNIHFDGVKLCSRCTITTINQDDASKHIEPLRTLSQYRTREHKIYFGQNVLHRGIGVLNVGDTIAVHKRKMVEPFETRSYSTIN